MSGAPSAPGADEKFVVVPLTTEVVPLWFHVYNTNYPEASAMTFAEGWGNTRFAPICLPSGLPVHTWYGASAFECVLMESVFHDIALNPPGYFDMARLQDFRIARVELTQPIACVSFHTPFLPALNLTREQLIDSAPNQYPNTRKWAQAAFDQCVHAQAIAYGSRRDDAGRCLMLFGQRLSGDLMQVLSDEPLSVDPYRDLIVQMAARLGISIV